MKRGLIIVAVLALMALGLIFWLLSGTSPDHVPADVITIDLADPGAN